MIQNAEAVALVGKYVRFIHWPTESKPTPIRVIAAARRRDGPPGRLPGRIWAASVCCGRGLLPILRLHRFEDDGSLHLPMSLGRDGRSRMIAQDDDPSMLGWLVNAETRGGHFISSLAKAALYADWENYPLLRPLLVVMREKYREYEPSEVAKQKIEHKA